MLSISHAELHTSYEWSHMFSAVLQDNLFVASIQSFTIREDQRIGGTDYEICENLFVVSFLFKLYWEELSSPCSSWSKITKIKHLVL